MSSQVNLTQEKWNMILDLKDMVNNHNQTINKMAKVINDQQKRIAELEVKVLKNNTNTAFNDIFSQDIFNGRKK